MNENIESIIKYLDLAETLGVEEVKLSGCELRVLNDHLRTLYEQKKLLTSLVKYLNIKYAEKIERLKERIKELEHENNSTSK